MAYRQWIVPARQRPVARHAQAAPLIRCQRQQRHIPLYNTRPPLYRRRYKIRMGRRLLGCQRHLPPHLRRRRQPQPQMGDNLYRQHRYRLLVLQRTHQRQHRHLPLAHQGPADEAHRAHHERLQEHNGQYRRDREQGYRGHPQHHQHPDPGFPVAYQPQLLP